MYLKIEKWSTINIELTTGEYSWKRKRVLIALISSASKTIKLSAYLRSAS
jgi:hypothetical protein